MLQVNLLSADTKTLLETLPTPKLDLTMHVLVYEKKTCREYFVKTSQSRKKLKPNSTHSSIDDKIETGRQHWWRSIALFPISKIAGNRVSDREILRGHLLFQKINQISISSIKQKYADKITECCVLKIKFRL